METRPPTITRILVAVGFALSCFALALFLWIAFGGPLPLKPRATGSRSHSTRRPSSRCESDVRISGVSVGKVKSIDAGRQWARRRDDPARQPLRADSRRHPGDPAQKTLLGETYVELTPGDRNGPDPAGGGIAAGGPGRRLGPARRDLPHLQRRVRARISRSGCRGRPGPSADAARTSRPRSPSSSRSPTQTNRLLRVLDSQRQRGPAADPVGGDVFQALSERQGQLRGLIQNSAHGLRGPPRAATRTSRTCSGSCPPSSASHASRCTRLDSFAQNTDPLVQQLRPAARQLSPTLVAAGKAAPDLKAFFKGLRGAIKRPPPGFPALRRLLGRRPHTSPRPGWAATSTASAPTWPT